MCVSVTGPDTRFKNTLVSEQVCISGRYSFETGFRIDHSCFWTLSKHMFRLSNSFGGITLPSLCFDKWFVVLTENSHGRNMWQPAAGEHSTLTTLPHNHRLSMLSLAAFDCSSSADWSTSGNHQDLFSDDNGLKGQVICMVLKVILFLMRNV